MKISLDDELAEVHYAGWFSQLIRAIDPRSLYVIGGRGVAKTSDIMAGRMLRVMADMPRGVFAIVGPTYVDVYSNIIPEIMRGWERMGFLQDKHYVIDQPPPDSWHRPLYVLEDWKRSICCKNGALFIIRSADRPRANAGYSVMHQFIDECKLAPESKLKKAIPTLRGDKILFGHSPFFRGVTCTTDMPHVPDGEDDWILSRRKEMNLKQIWFIFQAFMQYQCEVTRLYHSKKKNKPAEVQAQIESLVKEWYELWRASRLGSTFYYEISTFANVDFITFDYIVDQFKALDYSEFKRAILSIYTNVDRGSMFYPALDDKIFYKDGFNYQFYDQFGIQDNIKKTSEGLRYCLHDQELDAGVDVGNMMSMVIGQEQGTINRIIKNLFVLSPRYIRDLADEFLFYFSAHKYKVLNLWHDRAANNYKATGHDVASELKHNLEYDKNGRSTGWRVNLMSIGQGNITHQEEYDLCEAIMSGRDKRFPRLLIDLYECKELKSSMEIAEARTVIGRDARKRIQKVKTSEKRKLSDLPMLSTNMSDAFKYYICRRKYLNIIKHKSTESFT